MAKKIKYIFLFTFLFVFSLPGFTQHEPEHGQNGHEENSHSQDKKFNPGAFIFDHIADSHGWHIFTYKGKHISMPLPVIIYSRHSGFHIFSSAKFHHGHAKYLGFELPAEGEHKGKIIEHIGEGEIYKPIDLSITKNVLAIFISLIILVLIIFAVAKAYKRNPVAAPKGLQNLMEPVILFIRNDVAIPSIGKEKHEKFMPFLLTLFLFILINNVLGLIPILPGGANVTGNIAVTMSLAIFTFLITTFRGNKNYWKHIFNTPGVPWFLKLPIPLMPIIEFLSIFIRPIVLMIRLFANITAGHIIALGIFSLIFIFGEMSATSGYGISAVTIAFSIFMTCVELLVAFIQAFIFTLLSAIYFGMAVEEHH